VQISHIVKAWLKPRDFDNDYPCFLIDLSTLYSWFSTLPYLLVIIVEKSASVLKILHESAVLSTNVWKTSRLLGIVVSTKGAVHAR
jgi:hypothetical protein